MNYKTSFLATFLIISFLFYNCDSSTETNESTDITEDIDDTEPVLSSSPNILLIIAKWCGYQFAVETQTYL